MTTRLHHFVVKKQHQSLFNLLLSSSKKSNKTTILPVAETRSSSQCGKTEQFQRKYTKIFKKTRKFWQLKCYPIDMISTVQEILDVNWKEYFVDDWIQSSIFCSNWFLALRTFLSLSIDIQFNWKTNLTEVQLLIFPRPTVKQFFENREKNVKKKKREFINLHVK